MYQVGKIVYKLLKKFMTHSVEQKKIWGPSKHANLFLWPVAFLKKKIVIFSAINWTTNTPAHIYWDMLTILIQTT